MKMGRIEAILFDADGVLQRPKIRWRAAFSALPGLSDEVSLETFCGNFILAEELFLESRHDFLPPISEITKTLSSEIDPNDIIEIVNNIEVDWNILKWIQDIRSAGIECHIASNQQSNRAKYMSETLRYGDLFDREYYSCWIGAAKPKTDFFRFILSDLRRNPERILLFDDSPKNVSAARDAGLNAEVFQGVSGADCLRDLAAQYGIRL